MALKGGRALKGREIFFVVQRWYATGKTAERLFNLRDLQAVRVANGNLQGFQNSWVMVLSGMKTSPDADTLEVVYYEAIQGHRGLAEDLAHYNRLEEGSGGDRSYAFLYECVERHLRVTRQAKTREELHRGIGSQPSSTPALGAPEKGGKGNKSGDKKGNKGSGKSRSSSASGSCRFFAEGNCKKGKDCPHSHDLPQRKGKGRGKSADGRKKSSDLCFSFRERSVQVRRRLQVFSRVEACSASPQGQGAASEEQKEPSGRVPKEMWFQKEGIVRRDGHRGLVRPQGGVDRAEDGACGGRQS